MAELTITQELELQWRDPRFTDQDEKHFKGEFDAGMNDYVERCILAGHTKLIFDINNLVPEY